MLEPSQDLPFAAKTSQNEIGVISPAYQLDSHTGLVLRVGTFGKVYRAHASLAKFTDETPVPDQPPFHRRFRSLFLVQIENGLTHIGVD